MVASGGGRSGAIEANTLEGGPSPSNQFRGYAVERQRVEMGHHFVSGTWMDVIIQRRCSHLGGFSIAAQRRGREENFKSMDRISLQLYMAHFTLTILLRRDIILSTGAASLLFSSLHHDQFSKRALSPRTQSPQGCVSAYVLLRGSRACFATYGPSM